MINKEWPLSGQRQCRTNSTKLQETDKEKKILSVMDIILTHSLVPKRFYKRNAWYPLLAHARNYNDYAMKYCVTIRNVTMLAGVVLLMT